MTENMRLTDLNPRWVGINGWSSGSAFYIGVTFDSPLRTGQRLSALFTPPIDPDGLMAKYGWGLPFPDQKRWQRNGDTFETLTLSPSLDFSGAGDWHGFISNGEASFEHPGGERPPFPMTPDPEILETYGSEIAAITRRADQFDEYMAVVHVTDVAEIQRQRDELRKAVREYLAEPSIDGRPIRQQMRKRLDELANR